MQEGSGRRQLASLGRKAYAQDGTWTIDCTAGEGLPEGCPAWLTYFGFATVRSLDPPCDLSADSTSSAKQPLVRAPNAIKEPSLLRKLTAAGAQATLSPVRKSVVGKENAEAGPSRTRRRMDPVGEEEEENEEEPLKRTEVDHADLALQQKARIVSQMAAMRLSPRKTVPTTSSREAMAPARTLPPAPVPAPAPREVRSGKQRVSLFESVAKNLTEALHAAQTSAGFYSSGECIYHCRRPSLLI
jgi:polo-like kinase 1